MHAVHVSELGSGADALLPVYQVGAAHTCSGKKPKGIGSAYRRYNETAGRKLLLGAVICGTLERGQV